jgi:hypothetical protein
VYLSKHLTGFNMRFIPSLLFTLFAFMSCTSPPESPSPQSPEQAADAAFERLDQNVGVSEVEKDLSGVVSDARGAITNMDIIAEPTAAERAKYSIGEPGWIEVEETRVFSNSVAPDKAKQELLQILRNSAVSKKVPAHIEVTSLLTDMMSEVAGQANEQTAWSGFFRSTVSGVITAEEVLADDMKPLSGKNSYEKTVRLKAFVEPVRGQRDPGFYVDAAMENTMLKQGYELAFSVRPSKDCYLYVFNLMADHNAVLMFPNEYMTDNFVPAGDVVQIPDSAVRQYIRFVVASMPGEALTTESAYIVCSKERLPMMDTFPRIGTELKVFSGRGENFINMQRWLTDIPLDQRVEKNLVYHISK